MAQVTLYNNCGCFTVNVELDPITQSFIDDMANCKNYFSGCEAESYNNLVKKLKTVVFAATSLAFPETGIDNTLYVDVTNLVLYVWKVDSYFAFSSGSGSVSYMDSLSDLPITGQDNFLYIIKTGFLQAIWNGSSYDITSQYTEAEKTKLAGIQAGATANASDASTRSYIDNAVEDALSAANEYATTAASTSQANAEAYADSIVTGLWDDRGNYNASGNTFPASGGSGTSGVILKGDIWTISVAGTLGGTAVNIGDTVRALTNTPGQTAGNWAIAENNIGYVPENQANKVTNIDSPNNTSYPTTQAVATAIAAISGGGGIAGNLILNKTSGGQVGYDVPDGYTFDIDTLYDDELATLITKLAETFPPAPIPYPDGWTWKPTIPLRYNDGSIGCSLTTDDFGARYMVRGKRYFVAPVANGGSALNTGASAASPLTMEAAHNLSDCVEIWGKTGYYTAAADFPSGSIRKTVSIFGYDGPIYMGRITQTDEYRHLDPTGTPGIYYSEYAGANGLVRFDLLDNFNNRIPLKKVFTEAEMLSTENTYYIYGYPDHGMRCHLPVSFIPDNLVNCMLIETGAFGLLDVIDDATIVNQTVYLRNVYFAGQVIGRMNTGCKVYMQDCSFLYAQNDGDELIFTGGEEVIVYKSNFGYCRLDAISFTSTLRAAILECNGIYANLYDENISNQISTAHSGTIVVRIGGNYFNSEYAIVDVTGSQSFNVGIRAENTVSPPFQVWDGGATGYFLDCSSDFIDGNYGARSTATAYLQGPKQAIASNPQSGGTLKYYGIYD